MSGGIDAETEQIAPASSQLCGKGLLCEDPILMHSTLLEDALVFCNCFSDISGSMGQVSFEETKRFVGRFGS